MDEDEAVALIRDAVGEVKAEGDGTRIWADLGAGTGTFTRALVRILGAGSTTYAVDDDSSAVASLRAWAARTTARVIVVQADFTQPFEFPGAGPDGALFDGILLANALHFVRDAETVLKQIAQRVRTGGRIVVVEYDRRAPSRWVPYPIHASRWPRLAASVGLEDAAVTATRPSAYSGVLYAAVARRR